MNNLRNLASELELRFRHVAEGHEKFYILNLLKIYYPILQKGMITTIEVRQSKMNLKELESECLHLETTRKACSQTIFICDSCGKTIYK